MPHAAAATPQLLRRVNAQAVLRHVRGADAATGTELMALTGLTRASVIAVCEDLIGRGWIVELDQPRTEPRTAQGTAQGTEPHLIRACPPFRGRAARPGGLPSTGRPASCWASTSAPPPPPPPWPTSAARSSAVPARASAPRTSPPQERIGVVDLACRQALEAAGTDPGRVLAVGAGIAAPVDRDGNVLVTQRFWSLFDVGLRSALKELHGWTVLLENDANLAALGERWRGSGAGVDDLVVLLAGERLGAGVMESGRLLHGRGGAAGEMGYLDMVEGVGSSDGIAALARQWSAAGGGPSAGGPASAPRVFEDAAAGDPAALAILDRISERMTRVIASIASLINPEQVVIGGAVAESAGALLPGITALLPRFTATPPRVTVSPLGDAIVTVGAVRHALDYVEANALELALPAPA